jgi:hypothetical protein
MLPLILVVTDHGDTRYNCRFPDLIFYFNSINSHPSVTTPSRPPLTHQSLASAQSPTILSFPLSLPPNPAGHRRCLRLVALVVLYLHTLKENILPDHRNFAVQYQFSRIRHPLYLVLHTNNQLWGPLVSVLFTPAAPSLSVLLLLSSLCRTHPLVHGSSSTGALLVGVAGRVPAAKLAGATSAAAPALSD